MIRSMAGFPYQSNQITIMVTNYIMILLIAIKNLVTRITKRTGSEK